MNEASTRAMLKGEMDSIRVERDTAERRVEELADRLTIAEAALAKIRDECESRRLDTHKILDIAIAGRRWTP